MRVNNILYCVIFMLLGCKESAEYGDGVLMTGTASDNLVKFAIDEQDTYAVSVTSTACVERDVKIHLEIKPSLVDEYNLKMGTSFHPVPEEAYILDTNDVTILSGQSISSAVIISMLPDKRSLLIEGRAYLLPITIIQVDSNLPVIESGRTIFLKLSKSLYFTAPYVGTTNTTNSFFLDNPATGINQYTWEIKFKAEKFERNSANEPIRIGGWHNNMLRFGEGGNFTNILEVPKIRS